MLRSLGLSLSAIGRVVEDDVDEAAALRTHLEHLRDEQQRLERQMRSVRRTITALTEGGPIMAEEMFDGFDHTEHREEVEQRWGTRAYADGNAWWTGLADDEQKAWQRRVADLSRDWTAAATAGADPDSEEAQALARRHAEWLVGVPGTPRHGTGAPAKEYLLGLGDLYVADPRFAANYGGVGGATFVRDTLRVYADRNL